MERFEAADGGTLFLDEVGDLPAEAQIALLRVLQEREFERVGSHRPIPVDVRVVAATNRDLKTAVASAQFRRDLFYRLNVVPIEVPPLRERLDDIPVLVEYLVERCARKVEKEIRRIDKQTMQLLQAYEWPGNIRELRTVIERAVVLCDGDTLDAGWFKVDVDVRKASLGGSVSRGRRDGPGSDQKSETIGLPRSRGQTSGTLVKRAYSESGARLESTIAKRGHGGG